MKKSFPFWRRLRRALAWLNLGCVLVLMWLAWPVGENWWLATLLTYPPQQPFLVPTLLCALIALCKREWFEWRINALALLLGSVSLLGWQMPLPNVLSPATSPRQNASQRRSSRLTRNANPRVLRVMSYNVLGGALGIENVARTIRAQNPDIICLQEAAVRAPFGDATPKLQKLLPEYQMARAREVTTFSRFPIVETREIPFGGLSKRAFLRTIIEIDGARLCVVNAHLWSVQLRGGVPIHKIPYRVNLEASNKIRGEQFERARDLAKSSGLPSIIAGDFNTPPRGQLYTAMSREYHDAFGVRGGGFGQTFPAKFPLIRIDYLWSSAGWRPQNAWTVKSYASDHRPLMAEYRW